MVIGMAAAKSFRELNVYKLAREAAGMVFRTSKSFPREERFSLTDQIRRSSRAVNAMIVNQTYHSPGTASRVIFRLINGKSESSYAGRVIGPAVNLLPEDRDGLPDVVPVEWLNLGCTIYRREALPDPPFDPQFTGYSLMEDLALSLRVGRQWRLANVRKARIFHDSQPGPHKANVSAMATMELVNRHYVMTEILERRSFLDYFRLFEWEIFQLVVSAVRSESRPQLAAICRGKVDGLHQMYSLRRRRCNL